VSPQSFHLLGVRQNDLDVGGFLQHVVPKIRPELLHCRLGLGWWRLGMQPLAESFDPPGMVPNQLGRLAVGHRTGSRACVWLAGREDYGKGAVRGAQEWATLGLSGRKERSA